MCGIEIVYGVVVDFEVCILVFDEIFIFFGMLCVFVVLVVWCMCC